MIKNKLLAWIVMGLMCVMSVAHAETQFNFDHFSTMPVVHEGRLKPLGRAAQLTLQKTSGIKAPVKQATAWFASMVFDPAGAETANVFHVANSAIIHALDLPTRESGFYDFQELNSAFIKKSDLVLSLRNASADSLTDDQQALLELYANVTYFEQVKGALTLVLPLKDGANGPKRLIDFKQGTETKITRILIAQGKNNQSLRIVPVTENKMLSWHAPWEIYTQQTITKDTQALLKLWGDVADSYIKNNADAWNATTGTLYQNTLNQSGEKLLSYQLKTELIYNTFQPYLFSMAFYAIALILSITAKRIAIWPFIAAGLAFHLLGIACRIIILQRPPVSDLYESILFVGAIIVGSTLLYGWRNKDKMILQLGAFLGIILHGVGFAMTDGMDTLKVLQAVLDTKFWLATHVIIITTGYAFCLMTSAFAHYCLYKFPASKTVSRRLYVLTLISLLLICTGTLLGGVWADQSWGRFWGWDPKENGALLIALWLVWLLHGKISRHINEFYFTVGLVSLSFIVALSWIGVNLLGVGLHSYGFTNGSISSLLILSVLEAVFIAICFKRNHHHAR